MNVCAFTSLIEEDACWLPQYLREAERLAMPFAMLLDRCSDATAERVRSHPLCVGVARRATAAGEFTEDCKQAAFDIAVASGATWAMAWDCDETYERDAPRKIAEIAALDVDYVDVRWVNLWGDARHVRTDGPFGGGHRVKFYHLRRRRWKFTHTITNGPKMVDRRGEVVSDPSPRERAAKHDLVCVHWGMYTPELRRAHKERWDRIYTAAVGNNPYGFWSYAIETEDQAVLVEHDYF
jgi:hypothetical protein